MHSEAASAQPTQQSDIAEISGAVFNLTVRLHAILDSGQSAINRRYGVGPEMASDSPAPVVRTGTLGALRDAVDGLEVAVGRAAYVVDRLGDA